MNRPLGHDSRRGGAMVFVVLMVAATSVLSVTLLSSIRSNQREAKGTRQDMNAFYVCEAGVSTALMDMANGGEGNVGTSKKPVMMGDGAFWVTRTDLGAGVSALRATGGDEHARVTAEVVVRRSVASPFQWGAFGDEDMHMDANAMVDSYDPDKGTYASQAIYSSGSKVYANSSGDVGSNASITMESNTAVFGDAHPGPSDTVNRVGSKTTLTGSATPQPTPMPMPAILVPTLVSSGPYTVHADATLPPGDHRFDDLTVGTGATLTVQGPARIVCSSYELMSSSSFLVDDSKGPVEVWVEEDFILNSKTTAAPKSRNPSSLSFNLLSDNILNPIVSVELDEVAFESNSVLYGTVYAPNAAVEIDSNFELYGSLVARRVDLDSNSKVHYDESLARTGNSSTAFWDVLCWRLVPEG